MGGGEGEGANCEPGAARGRWSRNPPRCSGKAPPNTGPSVPSRTRGERSKRARFSLRSGCREARRGPCGPGARLCGLAPQLRLPCPPCPPSCVRAAPDSGAEILLGLKNVDVPFNLAEELISWTDPEGSMEERRGAGLGGGAAWGRVPPHGAPAGDGRASEGGDGAPRALSLTACKAWARLCVTWSSSPLGGPSAPCHAWESEAQIFQLKNEMPRVPPRIQMG